jgi:hypothetical protein
MTCYSKQMNIDWFLQALTFPCYVKSTRRSCYVKSTKLSQKSFLQTMYLILEAFKLHMVTDSHRKSKSKFAIHCSLECVVLLIIALSSLKVHSCTIALSSRVLENLVVIYVNPRGSPKASQEAPKLIKEKYMPS